MPMIETAASMSALFRFLIDAEQVNVKLMSSRKISTGTLSLSIEILNVTLFFCPFLNRALSFLCNRPVREHTMMIIPLRQMSATIWLRSLRNTVVFALSLHGHFSFNVAQYLGLSVNNYREISYLIETIRST